jgi:hypothetical protein
MSGGARIAGDASDARRSASLPEVPSIRSRAVFTGTEAATNRLGPAAIAALTPEKTLNFGTAPAHPRLNFESQEKCFATKEEM